LKAVFRCSPRVALALARAPPQTAFMRQAHLVRHGQTEWNLRGLYQGHEDSPLTALGLAQAEALAAKLAPLRAERLVSSDLGRARATAGRIAARLALPVELDARLRELDLGLAAGRDKGGLRELAGYELRPDWRFPGGESFTDLEARVLAALRELAHAARTAIVVTHAGPIRAALRRVRGLSFAEALEIRVEQDSVVSLDLDALGS
jgi:probable phosphoglycerate mutase